jgi:hypothetical protein
MKRIDNMEAESLSGKDTPIMLDSLIYHLMPGILIGGHIT